MDTAPSNPIQRISGRAELLQAVPYLLGFHPARSLVLLGLDAGRLVVTARLDLADAERPDWLAHTIEALSRGGSSSIVAAVYDDAADPAGGLPWGDLVDAVIRQVAALGCALLDALLVCQGRWWSLLCEIPGCCPPDGEPLPVDPSPFAAAATVEGLVALPDRAALSTILEPVPAAERARLQPTLSAAETTLSARGESGHRSVKRALFAAARTSDQPGWPGLADADLVRFGAALTVRVVRDAVWLAVDDGRLDGRPLWRDLARQLPAPQNAHPLFLYGWASWRSGNATMAAIAAEHALASDPDYAACDLLLAALAHALNPHDVPKLRASRSA